MKLLRLPIAVVSALLLVAVPAGAASFTVHNTGVDGTDITVAPGGLALFWTLQAKPGGATEVLGSLTFRFHNPAYFPDQVPTAAWVSSAASGNVSAFGVYTYHLVFDLTGFNPSTAVLGGIFGTDNDGSIRLNGGAAVASQGFGGFGVPTAFTMNSGNSTFLPGLNSIEVLVNNGGNPTAFFVRFSTGTADASVPEPTSLMLFGTGALLMICARRRRL